ncbi:MULTISPECIES: divalent-cation tolerance protein CutA [unclassified Isoptericola]|uniref:divalent-cation tolerance protein CutA n=1 Tax=unclassified Isoptericola TaxID=2623355 RepID=UPI00271336AA|nr:MULTISPECIES: divalent-cation tolerance protein CutA [unclassified Isoptericola]MDO8144527.1 divalent-cation tolerance protein CutA [Isoptericola sp. 178]MDO8148371.1 divalent-cation tolerance protein CutA [Isoptericola sp. b515]MDO8151853.1 divalent-cation tolerance protein CutA [Isoptericola sp. b408]
MDDVVQVVTTIDSEDTANKLVRDAVARRLAACGQVDGPVTSAYWWDGSVETATEWRATFRTTADRAGELQTWLIEQHPYEVPEVLVSPVTDGNPDYLAWVRSEVG